MAIDSEIYEIIDPGSGNSRLNYYLNLEASLTRDPSLVNESNYRELPGVIKTYLTYLEGNVRFWGDHNPDNRRQRTLAAANYYEVSPEEVEYDPLGKQSGPVADLLRNLCQDLGFEKRDLSGQEFRILDRALLSVSKIASYFFDQEEVSAMPLRPFNIANREDRLLINKLWKQKHTDWPGREYPAEAV